MCATPARSSYHRVRAHLEWWDDRAGERVGGGQSQSDRHAGRPGTNCPRSTTHASSSPVADSDNRGGATTSAVLWGNNVPRVDRRTALDPSETCAAHDFAAQKNYSPSSTKASPGVSKDRSVTMGRQKRRPTIVARRPITLARSPAPAARGTDMGLPMGKREFDPRFLRGERLSRISQPAKKGDLSCPRAVAAPLPGQTIGWN
jgi:hypothetical protein